MHEKVFASKHQWNLYASSGRVSLGGSFAPFCDTKDGAELLLTQIEIAGIWPDKTQRVLNFRNLLPDFSIRLEQLIIPRPNALRLLSCSKQWLAEQKAFEVDLISLKTGEALRISINSKKSLGTLGKGIAALEYSGFVFEKGSWSFEVDQSCVGLFAGELAASLSQ